MRPILKTKKDVLQDLSKAKQELKSAELEARVIKKHTTKIKKITNDINASCDIASTRATFRDYRPVSDESVTRQAIRSVCQLTS